MKLPLLTTICLLYICIVVDLAIKLICCSKDLGGGSIWLCISMTTLNSEEITLWSASGEGQVYLPLSLNDNFEQWRDHSVLWQYWVGGLSDFGSHWLHWTVKRSLCGLPVLGGISAFESQWQLWTVKRSLCALTVLVGGSIWLCISLITLNSEEITQCCDSVDQGGLSDFESQWQLWTVKRSLFPLLVLTGGVYHEFYQVILTFPYIFLLIDFSWYFPIRWLFLIYSY